MNVSKLKNLQVFDKKGKFTNCSLGTLQDSNRLIAVNKKYLAMIWENNKKLIVMDSSKPMKVDEKNPYFNYQCQDNVLDLEFSPFNDNILTSSINRSVVLWNIEENEAKKSILKEKGTYKNH